MHVSFGFVGGLIDLVAKSRFEPSVELGEVLKVILASIERNPSPNLKELKDFLQSYGAVETRCRCSKESTFLSPMECSLICISNLKIFYCRAPSVALVVVYQGPSNLVDIFEIINSFQIHHMKVI